MSVLMTIKYPVSNPPTLEQLEAIPKEVFSKWLDTIFYHWYSTPKSVHEYMTTSLQETDQYLLNLKIKSINDAVWKLRNLIFRMDE